MSRIEDIERKMHQACIQTGKKSQKHILQAVLRAHHAQECRAQGEQEARAQGEQEARAQGQQDYPTWAKLGRRVVFMYWGPFALGPHFRLDL